MRPIRRIGGGCLAAAICLSAGGCYSSSGHEAPDSSDAPVDARPDAADDDAGEPEVDPSCPDRDGDGFRDSACGGTDCDDTRADVYPDAREVCLDGIDNDCDGLVDGPTLLSDDLLVSDRGNIGDPPTLLWTGEEFVVAWSRQPAAEPGIGLARIPASGDGVEREIRVTEGSRPAGEISLAWTGTEIAVAWADGEGEEFPEIHFALLGATGAMISEDVRVTFDPWLSACPQMVWTGSEFAVAWIDTRLTESSCTMMGCSYDIYLARLDPRGEKIGDDLRVSDRAFTPGGYWAPVWIAWTGADLGIFWSMLGRVLPDGSELAADLDLGHDTFYGELPVWTGSEYGLLWANWPADPPYPQGIYFIRRGADGAERGRSLLEPGEDGTAAFSLAWADAGFGAIWQVREEGGYSVRFQSLTVEGEPRGPKVSIAGGAGLQLSHHALAWTGSEFGVAWSGRAGSSDAVFFNRIGFCD